MLADIVFIFLATAYAAVRLTSARSEKAVGEKVDALLADRQKRSIEIAELKLLLIGIKEMGHRRDSDNFGEEIREQLRPMIGATDQIFKDFLSHGRRMVADKQRIGDLSANIHNDLLAISRTLIELDLTENGLQNISDSHTEKIIQLIENVNSTLNEKIEATQKEVLSLLNSIKVDARVNAKNQYLLQDFERDLMGE